MHQRMIGWLGKTTAQAFVASKVGMLPRLAADEFVNSQERIRQKVKGIKRYHPPEDINYALLSSSAYSPQKEVRGYKILQKYSSPDRVVYEHQSGHKIIAFRGTDPTNLRDVSTDLLLATGSEALSHRFHKAEMITQELVQKYGKENVSVTGHSLGGSQAMHVSKKFGVVGHAYNPHTTLTSALTGANYPNVTLHVNEGDPISAFYPGAHFHTVDVRSHGTGLKAHGIENFVQTQPKYYERLTMMKPIMKREYAVQ